MFSKFFYTVTISYATPSLAVAAVIFAASMTPAQARITCAELTTETLGLPGVKIVASEQIAKDEKNPLSLCRVKGVTAERTGIDDYPYAVRFEIRLPDNWNGDFFHQLNGGDNGDVFPAMGPLLGGSKGQTALDLGYAVLSADGGHDGKAHPDWGFAGSYRFALDPEARDFFGYKMVETMAPLGKALITAYYGAVPGHSYAVGCSNGGRHSLMAAERLSSMYDGFLAGAPGFNLPKAAVQHAHDIQSFKRVNGDVRKAFSREDISLVANAVIDACDTLDGLADGMVLDSKACQAEFDIASLQCQSDQNTSCLLPEQVVALKAVHAGPINAQGKQLYSDWAWDSGISGRDWRLWKLESPDEAAGNLPRIAVKGAASLAYLFTTPPTEVKGDIASLEQFLLDFDLDTDTAKIGAVDANFTRSAMKAIVPPGFDNPTLAKLKAAGNKLIVFHGVSDPVFSANDTLAWYEALAANNGGSAADFVKYYPVPGMNHCSGGPATDNFNLFATLVDWVENGIEPQAVTAALTKGNQDIPEDWSAERTRKLCPSPQVARFVAGTAEQAESFDCTP